MFTQPDVHAGRGAALHEVTPMMEWRGYRRKSGCNFASCRLHVEDLHDGNVLVDEAGELPIIDPVIFVRVSAPGD